MADACIEVEVVPIEAPGCDQCDRDGVATHIVRAIVWLDGLGNAAERKVCPVCRPHVEREYRAMSELTMADEPEPKP